MEQNNSFWWKFNLIADFFEMLFYNLPLDESYFELYFCGKIVDLFEIPPCGRNDPYHARRVTVSTAAQRQCAQVVSTAYIKHIYLFRKRIIPF